MSIQRHFNFSSVENSTSDKHHPQYFDSQQNTILQENTEITQHKSNFPAAGGERVVFQPEDGDEKTITVESTEPIRQNTVAAPNNSNTENAIVSKNTESTKHHPHYSASQQNIILLENTKPDRHHPNLSAVGRERVVFQPGEDEKTIAVESTKSTKDRPATQQNTVVPPKNGNIENAIVAKNTESTKHYPHYRATQNSAIVKYNSNLPTVDEDEFLPPIGRWTKFGGLFIVAVVILAIPISAMTKYKETIKTQASVRPDGESRLVQAATEGRVTKVAVRNNQTVKKGEAIATIDDSRLQTQKSQLQDGIQKLRSQLGQIDAQIAALDNQVSAQGDRLDSSVAAAQSELDRVRREYQDKQIITQAEVRETESNLKAATSALKAAQAKLNRYQSAAQEGAISQDQLQEVQLTLQQQQQTVEATQAKLTSAQTTLNPSDAEVKSATSGIAEVRSTGLASLATLNQEKQALIQRRIETNQQIDRDTKELQQTNAELQQTIVTATSNGIISQLNLRNPGQIVRPGEQIAQIAPTNSEIVIKAAIPAKSIGKLEKGQTAQMRVSACPYSDYGTLKGTVTTIAPDTVVPQAENTNASATNIAERQGNASFYEVVIEPTKTILGKEDNQCVVQLGMEGQADIVTKEETVLQFLLRKARLTTNL